MAVRTNIPATQAASVSRQTLNANAGRANWQNVLEVADTATTTLAAAVENPESVYDAIEGSATSTACEVELPAISSAEDGRVLWVTVTAADGSNSFTLTPDGSDTIGGASSHVFTAAGEIGIRASNSASDWRVFMTSA